MERSVDYERRAIAFIVHFLYRVREMVITSNDKAITTEVTISPNYHGRTILFTPFEEITEKNVVQFIKDALPTILKNKSQINYLYNYYKGDQPIKNKTKVTRTEINNKVVVNRANEVVSFKTGYFCGEPIVYTGRGNDERVSENIQKLNSYMLSENKATKDKELVEWQMICGTAYRMVMADENPDEDEAPFEIYTLDPRVTAVAYSYGYERKPVAGIYITIDQTQEWHFSVYTDTMYYEVVKGGVIQKKPHKLGMIPIIEYPANNARLGCFEIVMPILDAINLTQSDRLDGIEQFINSLLVFYNCELGEDEEGNQITPQMLREQGALFLQSIGENKADLKEISSQLDQTNTQTLVDDMYQEVLTIVGMPTQMESKASDSSNNGAVMLRSGWQGAETRAKEQELSFIPPEREMLKLVLRICNKVSDLDLKQSEIEIKFTRRQYDNLQVKAQVLTTLLGSKLVAPIDAYVVCGLFSDPEGSVKRGLEWYNQENERESNNAIRPTELIENTVVDDNSGARETE